MEVGVYVLDYDLICLCGVLLFALLGGCVCVVGGYDFWRFVGFRGGVGC